MVMESDMSCDDGAGNAERRNDKTLMQIFGRTFPKAARAVAAEAAAETLQRIMNWLELASSRPDGPLATFPNLTFEQTSRMLGWVRGKLAQGAWHSEALTPVDVVRSGPVAAYYVYFLEHSAKTGHVFLHDRGVFTDYEEARAAKTRPPHPNGERFEGQIEFAIRPVQVYPQKVKRL